MMGGSSLARWKRGAIRLLGLLARPVRTAQGKGGIVIEPYRGYGSSSEIFLIGRVFWQSKAEVDAREDDLAADLKDIGRRLVRRAVRNVTITASFCGTEEQVVTDQDGYFRIHLKPALTPPLDRTWHQVDLRLDQPRQVLAKADIFIPPDRCRCVIISDIDDTIMHTGVANKIKMLWRLFVQDAEHRAPFPGVGALYRALHAGPSGNQDNPLLYVSRAPWGIYGVLDEFFTLHRIPIGPILFLREWGISWKTPLPRKAEDHKRDLIRNMLALYHDLPFVLIGDSGQHDPEVYREIVDDHPGRVMAVYIRNVSRDDSRICEIEALAVAVAEAGSSLLLAADSLAIAKHAARLGLVASESVIEIRDEAVVEGGTRKAGKTRRLHGTTPAQTAHAVSDGELQQILEGKEGEPPPNVVIEPGRHR